MRINVYSQELTKEVKLIHQKDRDGRNSHYGIRFFLASPDILHNTPDDDDRSAITFWIPNAKSFTPADLSAIFNAAAMMAAAVEIEKQG